MTDINKAIERLEGELIPAVSIDEADDIRTLIAAVRQSREMVKNVINDSWQPSEDYMKEIYKQLGGRVE